MDSPEQRAAHARWIASVLPELVEHGGDELAVIAEDLAGWIKGRREYGPLDLAAPRDLLQELADEERDSRNYLGALRVQARRRRAEEIAARGDKDDTDVPLPEGIDGAQLVAELEAARVAREADAPDPIGGTVRHRTRRPSASSLAELGSVLDGVAGGNVEDGGAPGR